MRPREDDMAAFRAGIRNAVLISIPVWTLIAWIFLVVAGHGLRLS